MRLSLFLIFSVSAVVGASPVWAQFKSEEAASAVRLGEVQTSRYEAGAIITAQGGPLNSMRVMIPVPFTWPEQEATIVEENLSPGAETKGYQDFDGVKRLIIAIPKVAGGEEIKCSVTFEVKRRMVLPPEDPSQLQIPKKAPAKISKYLQASPFIETRHREIVQLAKEAIAGKTSAWEKVEAICNLTREKVEYKTSDLKGALAALQDGFGDCEELTSLFIALCRVNNIPARTVWVPGHCFAEFYLEDAAGKGIWIPCQIAGTQAFPEMPDFRPILQKGDNFKVPEERKPQRYAKIALVGSAAEGSGNPALKEISKVIDEPAE